jgi:hypothetical protein
MSYTEIYRITKAGNTKLEGEIRNAHRGAMAVWTYLEEKYLPPLIKYGQKFTRVICSEPEEIQPLWDLAKDERLSEAEKICMLSTFDNVMVLKEDIPRLCKAFREFPGQTSLPEQADLIESLLKVKNCWAVCWNQTSVNADIPEKNVKETHWNLFESPL